MRMGWGWGWVVWLWEGEEEGGGGGGRRGRMDEMELVDWDLERRGIRERVEKGEGSCSSFMMVSGG